MSKEYIPLFLDFNETTQDLSDQECGVLIRSIVRYANGEEYEEGLTGGAKIAFRFMKGQVDRNATISEIRASARSNANKTNQNGTNGNKTEQNITNDNKTKENESKSATNNNNKTNNKTKTETKTETEDKKRALQENFDLFWALYPRKESKPEAQRAFAKINPDVRLLQDMLDSIEKWKKSPQWQERQYIPHPSTWLNNHRWEDEPPASTPPAPKPSPAASEYKQRDLTGADADATRRMLEWLDGGEL